MPDTLRALRVLSACSEVAETRVFEGVRVFKDARSADLIDFFTTLEISLSQPVDGNDPPTILVVNHSPILQTFHLVVCCLRMQAWTNSFKQPLV